MDETGYQVCRYNLTNLVHFLSSIANRNHSHESVDTGDPILGSWLTEQRDRIRKKRQVQYFDEYCSQSKIKHLVLEKEYVCRHFLADYAGYFAWAFHPYARYCGRIHFFGKDISEDQFRDQFDAALTSQDVQDIAATLDYRGFVVAKPLPRTVIGRSCLKPPYSNINNVEFPALHKFTPNLFGLALSVDSLVFQEQDSEVAACATTALWSALTATASMFQHSVLTPLEITRNAAVILTENRTFPQADGLSMLQMAEAIRSTGLEPVPLKGVNIAWLQAHLYAYLKARIPVIWLINFDLSGIQARSEGHAVTVAGFELGAEPRRGLFGLSLTAARMTRVFAHDDGVGPYAPFDLLTDGKIQLATIRSNESEEEICVGELVLTSWMSEDDPVPENNHRIPAITMDVLVPVHENVRVPFSLVLASVAEFEKMLKRLKKKDLISLPSNIEWDIYLTDVELFRASIRDDDDMDDEEKRRLLTMSVPRFIWRATGLSKS